MEFRNLVNSLFTKKAVNTGREIRLFKIQSDHNADFKAAWINGNKITTEDEEAFALPDKTSSFWVTEFKNFGMRKVAYECFVCVEDYPAIINYTSVLKAVKTLKKNEEQEQKRITLPSPKEVYRLLDMAVLNQFMNIKTDVPKAQIIVAIIAGILIGIAAHDIILSGGLI